MFSCYLYRCVAVAMYIHRYMCICCLQTTDIDDVTDGCTSLR